MLGIDGQIHKTTQEHAKNHDCAYFMCFSSSISAILFNNNPISIRFHKKNDSDASFCTDEHPIVT